MPSLKPALLPCSIIARQAKPDLTVMTFMDPVAVFGLADDEAVLKVGREARAVIEAVRDRLSGQHPVDLTT